MGHNPKVINSLVFLSVLVISMFFLVTNPAYSNENADLKEQSIGRLILLHDKLHSYEDGSNNPFGSRDVYYMFEKEYEQNIRGLTLKDRVDFFWSSMWHLGFGNYYIGQFLEILYADCGDAFMSKLQAYISKEEELQRNKRRLHISKFVYSFLESLKKIEDSKE